MSARGRTKPRRREISSHRYFHQQCGYNRGPTSGRAAEARPLTGLPESGEVTARPNLGRMETKTIIRLEGDSIAYFWALENETAISYETLMIHWRTLANAFMK